ncbi:hypothetical protein UFOVP54_98 [uncultured Caudovirales phage]|uniref:Uncharacterized protein n=1 Tax=uncultured Caudovirales phage TaxID=2100421 RepID=A0A6J5KS58_9CAUD|nr:hypothetical protein UFOVP54_98 [uncultured Caudovirales phage]
MTRHEDLLKQVVGMLDRMDKEDVVELFDNILAEMSDDRLSNILSELKANFQNK